jgi:FkbM family methyltransferase
MKTMRKYAKKAIFFVFKNIARWLVSFLPYQISSFLGKLGHTEIVERSSRVNFIGNVFETNLKINCQANYAVERIATARVMGDCEPFLGISLLGLRDFTMLDIGANVGAYSIAAAGIGAKRIFSIEPGPLFDRMKNNITLNSLEGIISPIKMGLSSKPGKMRWYEDLNNPGNAHLVISKDALSFEKITTQFGNSFVEVDVITLDRLVTINNIENIDLIKIDVEGMEWEVVSSGKEFIEKCLPVIVAETHRVASDMMRYDCITPLFNYLYSLGYDSYTFKNGHFIKFIYPNFELDTFFIPKGFRALP